MRAGWAVDNYGAPSRGRPSIIMARSVRRRIIFSTREFFGKKKLGRRDRFRPKIVEIGAILGIFEPFEILKIKKKIATCHFLENLADRPGIYIETPYETSFPRDVCLNSLKSGG